MYHLTTGDIPPKICFGMSDTYERALQKFKDDPRSNAELSKALNGVLTKEGVRDIRSGASKFPRLDNVRAIVALYQKAA